MAAVTWTDVTDLQSGLSTVSAGAQSKILAYVNEGLNPAAFGGEDSPRWTLARCYLAAHLGTLTQRSGTAGAVSSETYGTSAVSIAYGTTDEGLASTAWGQAYQGMLDASPLRIGLTSGPSC